MSAMVMRLGAWRVERTLGRDLSGTHYAGQHDNGTRATLYLLSGDVVAGRRDPLLRLLALHRELSHSGLVRFRELDNDGSDLYLIADAVDDGLASLRTGRPLPGQTRMLGAALAAALADAHRCGVVHGGLELDNVVWAPGRPPQILGTGVAALGIADHAALAHGDVAALGRLLCTLLAGRRPVGHDRPGAGGGTDSRTVELVRLLADPGAVVAMREAHALLSLDEPTEAVRASGGAAPGSPRDAEPDANRRRRSAGEPHASMGSGTATTHAAVGDQADAGAWAVAATRMPDRPNIGGSGGSVSSQVESFDGGSRSPPPGPDQLGGYLGRYRILTRLGRGGMGEVLLAEDPTLRRGVAIKRIRPGLERDRTFRARLRREAQLAARLSHRAIVQVFDLVTDDDADHVIMEYVPGPSLHTLTGNSPMEISEVVRIAAEVADGLAYAHQQGVIHRDLKRENILIGTDGQPKIADFGIARGITTARGTEESLTRDGVAIGTPRAMSPEQIEGRDIDARSDLFSFGVMLYELVTGTSPFAAGNDAVTLLRVLSDRQPPASTLVPEMPGALSELIDQLLEKTPARRPDSARAVRDRLRNLEGGPPPHPRRRAATPPIGAPTSRLHPASSPGTMPPSGERRQVTLVCIELHATSATDGAALADPEVLAEVLPAFHACVDEILVRFEGLLISELGHRFVACFGHPRPVEDAARRAVIAARAMLDAAARLRSVDPVHTEARFSAGAAVHTGLAVARGGGTVEELVLGATLDAALRMLQPGATGDLWLSGSTARLVEAEFHLEHPVVLRDGVTSARRFAGLRAASTGSGEHDRAMVARDHEMQLLLGSWRRARHGQGQVALLIGEPGIGKSRLTRALAGAIAGDEPRQIVLRGGAYRQRSALEPVAEAIAALLGVSAAAGTTGAAGDISSVAERIRGLTGADETAQILHFLGAADPPAGPPDRARHQLLGGLRDILVGTSHEVPTLIIAEDLHWLDPSTLDLLALIIKDVAAAPLFLLMTARPGFQPPWPAAAAVTQLPLGRLEASAIDAVITHACADRELSTAERARIVARSEGVPLYAHELVRAALELGHAGDVPSTLRDALTARLHQLGSSATGVAHVAAVVGREVTAGLIAAASGLDRAEIDRELERLVAAEILVRRRGRAREVLYQFAHVLLQQAAYEELLAADRRNLHGQLADALLADARAGRDAEPELVAHHLAGARRFGEAIASAERAAVRALDRHARIEARELFRQALSWLDQLAESDARDRTEIGLRMQLGAVLISTEGYTSLELDRSCRRTETLCARHDDMPLPVKHGLWAARFMRGTPGEVEPFLSWFEQVIERGGPPIDLMVAHMALGVHADVRARYDDALRHLARAMALFVPAEHASVVQLYGGGGGFTSHIVTTDALWQRGRIADAWQHVRATVAQAEALDPYAVVSALSFEMAMHIASGDTARTEATAERMLELSARYEFRYLACSALCGRGWALARRGQAERALTDLVTGTEGTKRIGVKVWYPYYMALLAEGAIVLGQFDRAEHALDEAFEVCRTSVDRSNEPELLRLRSRLILGRDGSAREPARAALADSVALARSRGALVQALRAANELAALLRDDHRLDEAATVLGPVYHGFAPGLDDPNLAAARQLLADLPGGAT